MALSRAMIILALPTPRRFPRDPSDVQETVMCCFGPGDHSRSRGIGEGEEAGMCFGGLLSYKTCRTAR